MKKMFLLLFVGVMTLLSLAGCGTTVEFNRPAAYSTYQVIDSTGNVVTTYTQPVKTTYRMVYYPWYHPVYYYPTLYIRPLPPRHRSYYRPRYRRH